MAKVQRVEKKEGNLIKKITKLKEKESKLFESKSPSLFRITKLQSKIQKLIDKLYEIQNIREEKRYIEDIHSERAEEEFAYYEADMLERYTRLGEISGRMSEIGLERREIEDKIAKFNDGYDDIIEEQEPIVDEDPIVRKTKRKLNININEEEIEGQDGSYWQEPYYQDGEMQDGNQEYNETDLELIELYDQLNSLNKERQDLVQERAQLRQERKEIDKDFRHYVKEAQKKKRQDVALINPSIFTRIKNFFKEKIDKVKEMRTKSKETKAKKLEELKSKDIQEPSEKAQKKEEKRRAYFVDRVDYSKIQERLDEVYNAKGREEQSPIQVIPDGIPVEPDINEELETTQELSDQQPER